MKPRFRTVTLASLAIAIGTVAALVISEVGLRLRGFQFTLYPTAVQFGWPDPVTVEHRYSLDEELFWVRRDYYSTLDTLADRTVTVVHMGDSCTEIGRYDEHLASLILSDEPGSDYTFLNVGVGGWSSYQGRVQMERDIARLRPAVATIYYGWNDHWRSYGVEDRYVGDFIRDSPPWLLAASRLRIVQLVTLVGLLRSRRANQSPSAAPERVSLADFEANLVAMVRTARTNGISPVLITAPTAHRIGRGGGGFLVPRHLSDLARLVPLHQAYVEVVRKVSRDEGALLIDLHAEFAKVPVEEWDGLFSQDGIHPNERGNEWIAEIMYDRLVTTGFLARAMERVPMRSSGRSAPSGFVR